MPTFKKGIYYCITVVLLTLTLALFYYGQMGNFTWQLNITYILQ